MRLCKKHLALLLVLTMLVPLFTVGVSAAEPAAADLPIDYVFEDVTEAELSNEALNLSFDIFSSLQWDMKMIGMDEAWQSGLTGKNVRVGIVDSGLSNLTMDIDRNRIEKGVNYSPIKLNIGSPVMDTVGHGTFIAGIIGATKGNGVGIAGVAPGVTFVPIKCFSSLFTTPDAEVQGIYAAVDDYHCDVINLSSGSSENIKAMKEAVEYAISKGVIVISTVGNKGDDTLNYPGAYDGVIAVGSVNKDMQVSSFSNHNESVFVVAPGEDVYSLGTLPFTVKKSSGTSFSAPFVSGVAAMLREKYPQMNQNDFAEILKMSSMDLGDAGYDTYYGYGLLQAPAAIRAADVYFGNAEPVDPTPVDPPADPDPTTPIDEQFDDIDPAVIDKNAPTLSFDLFSSLQWDMKMIGMQKGWKSGLSGNGVRVGIIDTGVYTNTRDISSGRLLAGKNLVDASQPTTDTNGHGTFIAGIIGATKGNGVGIAGVAPGVTIVPLKTSTDGKSNTSINAQAIYAAVDEFHCDVINISTGSKNGSKTLHDAVKYAESKGVIIVCSTGNDGDETIHYPGGYEETIGVGFVTITQQASSFSHRNETITVVAPGEGVVSLGTLPYLVRLGGGSSYAAPFVTGLAALLKEKYPEMNKSDFEEILKMSSKDLGDPGYDTTFGYGLIQVPAAIQAADVYFGNAAPAEPEQPYTPSPSPISLFSDVLRNSWFYDAVKYVTDHNYMIGVSGDSFAPYARVTRAQVAQILYNMEGKPAFTGGKAFSDTASSAWYYTPVLWAEQNGLVKGYPNGCFGPDAPVTREQLATILYRYAVWKGLSADTANTAVPSFADFASVSGFAKDAMLWAASFGIMKGNDRGMLNPGSSATRAEVSAMLMNFDTNVR